MQTNLAFIFVLHLLLVGLGCAFWEIKFRPRNLFFLASYFFCFYLVSGLILQAQPDIFRPERASGDNFPEATP